MTSSVEQMLSAYERLTAEEQREFVAEVLRRAHELVWPPLDDETIDRVAEASFLEYDARVAADGEG